METTSSIPQPTIAVPFTEGQGCSHREHLLQYYNDAGPDYREWSPNYNMHFGYLAKGMNPFDREAMLNQMSLEVAQRLELLPNKKDTIIDMGCGLGATSRFLARVLPEKVFKGLTVVPWQVMKGNELVEEQHLGDRVELLEADYTNMPFEDNTADAVFAVESACHASGYAKDDLVQEMARVLKPGGRFAITDCFVKDIDRPMTGFTRFNYRKICENWAMEEMIGLDEIQEALKKRGFTNLRIEDVSWNVAPSVAHAPWVCAKFIVKKLFRWQRLKQQSVSNLVGSIMSVLIGLDRKRFSYCIISGTKT